MFRAGHLQETNPVKQLVKIIVLGDPGVGKTCLIERMAYSRYNDKRLYRPTIGLDFHLKQIDMDGKQVMLQLCDAAIGYPVACMRGADAAVVAFDLTNEKSFKNVQQYLDEIAKYKAKSIPVILVGTKVDDLANRRVKSEDMTAFVYSDQLNVDMKHIIQVSAKGDFQVTDVFKTAAELSFIKKPRTNAEEPLRASLITDLQKYINRINSHQHFNKQPDFSYGFWFFKKSRAINREWNYRVATTLLENLQKSEESIATIFDDVNKLRKIMISAKSVEKNPHYVDRGINSSELNMIIRKAKKATFVPERFAMMG